MDSLSQSREQMQNQVNSLNANNPLSEQFGQVAVTGPLAGAPTLQKILRHPFVQKYLQLMRAPAFTLGVQGVIDSPRNMMLVYAEITWVVGMIIFRSWRFSKSKHWAARLWTNLWTLGVLFLGTSVLLPAFILGDPYYQIMNAIFEVFFK